MKKWAAFIMLLLHINTYMFLPQCPEQDSFDSNGRQTDDINSELEYVRVVLGYDKTPDDEDDDNGNNFLVVKSCDFFCYQQQLQESLQPSFVFIKQKTTFPFLREKAVSDTCKEVATPPPNTTV